jgi:hypothetical protein
MAERISIKVDPKLFEQTDFSFAVEALEEATHAVRLLALSIGKNSESTVDELWRLHSQMERSAEIARALEARDWADDAQASAVGLSSTEAAQ